MASSPGAAASPTTRVMPRGSKSVFPSFSRVGRWMVSGGASLSRSRASPLRHTSSTVMPLSVRRVFCSSTSPRNTVSPWRQAVTQTSSSHTRSAGNTASSRSAGASRS